MLTKTTLAVVAAAVIGFASSAIAAPKHHAGRDTLQIRNERVLRAQAQDLFLSSPRASNFNTVREPQGYEGYPDKYCTSCNLGSY
jgi:hypothetical protein